MKYGIENQISRSSFAPASTDPERWAQMFAASEQSGTVTHAMGRLVDMLALAQRGTEGENWIRVARGVGQAVRQWTNHDPLSRRCVEKPRGYAGDAATLDIIYRHQEAPLEEVTCVGRSILAFTNNRPATCGVRMRRRVLADAIDAAARRSSAPKVLSLACGHLREAELSRAVEEGALHTLYAVDQDPESLALIDRTHPNSAIRTVHRGVKHLLKGERMADDLDLAYSAGLYDYLDDDVAQRTTSALFDMVKPGGKVLVANFHPDLPDIGYMEACMDWWLIYRDAEQTRRVFGGIPDERIADVHVWVDAGTSITYALATKR